VDFSVGYFGLTAFHLFAASFALASFGQCTASSRDLSGFTISCLYFVAGGAAYAPVSPSFIL
jgi:hypothetical protein